MTEDQITRIKELGRKTLVITLEDSLIFYEAVNNILNDTETENNNETNHNSVSYPNYTLGKKSKRELIGVHPDLVAVTERAIQITLQDFSVFDGIRTKAEQSEYVRTGVSKKLKSKHIIGEAVDLVPYINGKPRWEWEPIYKIATAMRHAADERNVRLRWGGVWDRELTGSTKNPADMVHDYIDRRRKKGKKAFIDGPHFELIEPRE